MWRLAAVLLILAFNLGYAGSKIAADFRARRWAMALLGVACTVGVYAIILVVIYLSVQSSTDL
jgi:hypothetical protein